MDKRDGLQYIPPRNGNNNNNYPSKIKSKSKYNLILDQFYSNLRKKISVVEFKENLASCETNVDKINLVSKYFTWKPTHPLITRKYSKNSEISCDFRNVGNAAYQRHCFVEAVKSYNLALLFAAPGKAEVGLAYANRSAALYSLGQVEEALEDIERAVSSNYPKDDPEKWKKLQNRKIRYEESLKERQRDEFECELKEEIAKRSTFCKNMFTLKSPNSMVPAVEDFVEIKFNGDRGRHLVAKRDIPIGTTVLVETPFVAALENSLNFDLDHCHYCLKQSLTCIPCPNCVFALYCNEKCRSEALQKYHRYECPSLAELHCLLKNDRLLKHFYLVFKLVCIVGPSKLFAIFSKGKLNNSSHFSTTPEKSRKVQIISGSDPSTGVYSPDSYRAVYNLMAVTNTKANPRSNLKTKKEIFVKSQSQSNINGSNNNGKENDDINENEDTNLTLILMCLILSQTLSHYSGFFLELKIHDEELFSEFHNFIAQLMLHHFENFQRHIFELYEFGSKDGSAISLRSFMTGNCEDPGHFQTDEITSSKSKHFQFDFIGFATGIFPTLSLLNHSCDPSVARFTGKSLGQTAVVTLKPVRCGEELLISYGPLYGSVQEIYGSSKSRQSILLSGYQFNCDCIACQNDWPSILQLNQKNLNAGPGHGPGQGNNHDAVFSCSFCSVKFRHESKMSYEFLKCKLLLAVAPDFQSSQLLMCGLCNLSFLSQVLQDELYYHKQVLEMCRSLILENRPLQAISSLKSTLDFFARCICPPNYCWLVASQFYREAVDLIILFSKADD